MILEGVADHWPCMKKWRWASAEGGAVPLPNLAAPETPKFLLPSSPSEYSPPDTSLAVKRDGRPRG